MSDILNLGYLVFGSRDLDAWEKFCVNVVGMQVGSRSAELLNLRADDYEYRIQIESHDAEDIVGAGWEFTNEAALLAFVRRAADAGGKIEEATPELMQRRRVQRLFHSVDPSGIRHEFYAGASLARTSDGFRSQVLKSDFKTGRLGVGHFVAASDDVQRSLDFYLGMLGLQVSDHIAAAGPDGSILDVVFMHSATGRHHSLATAAMPTGGKRTHHFMLEYTDLDDVGLAYDRCLAADVPIIAGIGHHPNDEMISFYVRTPSGFGLELGWGGLVIDDANWEIRRFSELSDWGHRPQAA